MLAGTGAAIVFHKPVASAMSKLLDAKAPEEPVANVRPTSQGTRPWTGILAALDRTFAAGTRR